MKNNDQIRCPKCGSTQLSTEKKGFGVGKAAAGAVLTGGVGLLAGFIGSNKTKITCLKCGKKFNPGEGISGNQKTSNEKMFESVDWNSKSKIPMIGVIIFIIALLFIVVSIFSFLVGEFSFAGTMFLIGLGFGVVDILIACIFS